MPSLVSAFVRSQIGLINPLLKSLNLEQYRKLQDSIATVGKRPLSFFVHYKPVSFPCFDAAWAIPLKGRVNRAALYLHGGAYTAGTLPYAKRYGGEIAKLTGRATLCVGYRLAPEHPFPAALDDALAAYEHMLQRYSPEQVAFVGESAGGGLCYALSLLLKQKELPQPEKIVAISPWTDLTMTWEDPDTQACDKLLDKDALLESARMYASNASLTEPLISPLYGDLAGLPPSLMFAGSDEILRDDAVRMDEKLRAAGCASELHIEQGMWHVYVLYGVPEAKEALRQIQAYLDCDMEWTDGPEE